MMRRFAALILIASSTLACGNTATTASERPTRTITVLGASSLTEAFTQIGNEYEAKYPSDRVRFSFAGSPTLVKQIEQGAPADVFASADETSMRRVDSMLYRPARIFARNRLVIVVGKGNPKGIKGLSDLADPKLVLVLCGQTVPCGAFARASLRLAGIRALPDSNEESVKSVVTKVGLGEADAGIAYVTDAIAARERVDAIPIPDQHQTPIVYPIAVLRSAPQRKAAVRFTEFVLSMAGQRILQSHGFRTEA